MSEVVKLSITSFGLELSEEMVVDDATLDTLQKRVAAEVQAAVERDLFALMSADRKPVAVNAEHPWPWSFLRTDIP